MKKGNMSLGTGALRYKVYDVTIEQARAFEREGKLMEAQRAYRALGKYGDAMRCYNRRKGGYKAPKVRTRAKLSGEP